MSCVTDNPAIVIILRDIREGQDMPETEEELLQAGRDSAVVNKMLRSISAADQAVECLSDAQKAEEKWLSDHNVQMPDGGAPSLTGIDQMVDEIADHYRRRYEYYSALVFVMEQMADISDANP